MFSLFGKERISSNGLVTLKWFSDVFFLVFIRDVWYAVTMAVQQTAIFKCKSSKIKNKFQHAADLTSFNVIIFKKSKFPFMSSYR